MKKYDNYKDSGIDWIGEIPEHWKLIRIGSLSQCITGFAFKSENFSFENGIKIVRGDNVTENSLRWGDKTRYWNEYSEVLDRFQLQKNDIVIGMDGSKVGKNYAYVQEKDLPLLLVQRVARIRSNSELIAKWIHFNIGAYNFKYYINLSKTDPAIPHITLKNITSYPICIPDIDEQNQIINYLNHKTTQIDTLITKKEKFIILLQEERTALINQAVTKGLDPKVKMKDSGIEWLGEIPEHWEVKKLKLVFNPSKGLTITKENLKDEGIQCVNYGEIHSKFGFELDTNIHELKYVDSSYLESNDRSLIECGDFVFADTSEDIVGAGNFTYLKSEDKIFAGYHTIILKPIENLDSRFFAYEFDSIPFRTQIRQSVKGVKVFSITQAILKNVGTWFPPKSEQKSISDFLTIETEKIDSIILKAKEEIELLKEYKTALISEVVTGKIDVRNTI